MLKKDSKDSEVKRRELRAAADELAGIKARWKSRAAAGGTARAKKLSPERISEIARLAGIAGAKKRWGKKP